MALMTVKMVIDKNS